MTLEEQLLAEPTTSYWLRATIVATSIRDPLDALFDAQTLVRVLENRLDEVNNASSWT
jgi:hypothetical protein